MNDSTDTSGMIDLREELDRTPAIVSDSGVTAAIEHLEYLCGIARERGDRAMQFAILAQLGRWTAKRNLDGGLQLLLEAEAMLQQYPELSDDPNIADDRIYFAGQLAILLADDGRLSEALPRLQPAFTELRDTDHPHRHILANFYGQALAGLGRTPEALSVLSEADALDPEQNPGWAANNRMLQINILARHAGPASVVADTLVEEARSKIIALSLSSRIAHAMADTP